MIDDESVRDALRRQWGRIAAACEALDPDAPSRVPGWRNAEVLAHLAIQPRLLGRFLGDAGPEPPGVRLRDNLAGTRRFAAAIDEAARQAAEAGRIEFGRNAAEVDDALAAADLGATVTSLQGRIRLADYLRTRCVEAVVHGRDLRPPVDPDPVAEAIVVECLLAILHDQPGELAAARELASETFIDVATGRLPPTGPLAHVMPVMT